MPIIPPMTLTFPPVRILATTATLLLASLQPSVAQSSAVPPAAEDHTRLDNPDATPAARELFDYVRSLRGKAILSGQQEVPNDDTGDSPELTYIEQETGKRPAILGLDYIFTENVNTRALAWWKEGGIVSICWHWGAPGNGPGFKSSQSTIDVEEALRPGTEANRIMMADLDRIAGELAVLRDAGVPVLWRPLHEFDGGWFWWGKAGPDAFIRLWRLMHERYTKVHKLNNLVWVLGYSHKTTPGWYPGSEYTDISGADTYAEGTHRAMWDKLNTFVPAGIPLAYHECGPMPDPDLLAAEGPQWSWFLTWHTKHIREENSPERVRKVYAHPYVITLDELPKFGGRATR